MTSLLIQAAGVACLLVMGYVLGSLAERRHLSRLQEQEKALQGLPAIATRFPPRDRRYQQQLVSGNVVIASDYFKTFLAGLINIFGGRVTPFESMLDRARREALVRMKLDGARLAASHVFNVKFETTQVAGAMEVLAYGTAMIPVNSSDERSLAVNATGGVVTGKTGG